MTTIHKDDVEILEKMWTIRVWKNENKEDGCFWTEDRVNYSGRGAGDDITWIRLPKWLKGWKMSHWEKSKPSEIAYCKEWKPWEYKLVNSFWVYKRVSFREIFCLMRSGDKELAGDTAKGVFA